MKASTISLADKSLREVILDRLSELGVSRYDLAHYAGLSAAPSTVFRFLSGECNTYSGNLEEILDACGLQLVAKTVPDWAA